MSIIKVLRADKYWLDYSERIESPITRETAWQVCQLIHFDFTIAYNTKNGLKACVNDIKKEDATSRRCNLISNSLSLVMEKREALFTAFGGGLKYASNIIEEFRKTMEHKLPFGDYERCGSYVDAGGQLIADLLCILNNGLSQKNIDHWFHGDIITTNGSLESLLIAEERIMIIQQNVDSLFHGCPCMPEWEDLWRYEYLKTMQRLSLANDNEIQEIKKYRLSDVSPSVLINGKHVQSICDKTFNKSIKRPRWLSHQPISWTEIQIMSHQHDDKIYVKLKDKASCVVSAGELEMTHKKNGNPTESFRFLQDLVNSRNQTVIPDSHISQSSFRKKVHRLNQDLERIFNINARPIENWRTITAEYRVKNPDEPLPEDIHSGTYFLRFRLESN